MRWPWPGFTPHQFDPETDILDTKYLRKVVRIEVDEVDFNGGDTNGETAAYAYTCSGGSRTALDPFAVYQETEEWFEPEKWFKDGNSQFTVREGWVPDLEAVGREGAPEDDLASSSTLDDCGERETWAVTEIMQSPEDFVWPYIALLCPGGGSVTWADHLYQSALASWGSWIGSLVSTAYSLDGLTKTETYDHGTVTTTLSEPYTLSDAFGDAQALLDEFAFASEPLEIVGAEFVGDFTWGTGEGEVGAMTVEPWPWCDEGEPSGDYRGLNYLVAGMDVGKWWDAQTVYIAEAYIGGTGSWCLDWYEMTPIAGVALFDWEDLDQQGYTAPRAVVTADTGSDYGSGWLADSACP